MPELSVRDLHRRLITDAGEALSAAMKRRRLSQVALARVMGVSQPYVSMIVSGVGRNVTLRTLAEFASALDARLAIVDADKLEHLARDNQQAGDMLRMLEDRARDAEAELEQLRQTLAVLAPAEAMVAVPVAELNDLRAELEQPSAAQVRVDLAFRRLQIALLRSGHEFDGETLEAAVKAAARVVEGREP